MASDTFNMIFTGAQLQKAVIAAVAKECSSVAIPDMLDGQEGLVLGQNSDYPYRQLIVLADRSKIVCPNVTYKSVTIEETSWGGGFAIGYSNEDVIKAIKKFSLALKNALFEVGATQSAPAVIFEFEGSTYQCPSDARQSTNIVLPDGRVLTNLVWSNGSPPDLVECEILEHITVTVATKL